MSLDDLIARLEKAKGTDPDLDEEFHLDCDIPWTGAPVTASLDAIVGLIGRVLPGWSILMAISPHQSVCDLHTKPLGTVGLWPAHAGHKSAPLALCLAFAKALQSIKQQETAE